MESYIIKHLTFQSAKREALGMFITWLLFNWILTYFKANFFKLCMGYEIEEGKF